MVIRWMAISVKWAYAKKKVANVFKKSMIFSGGGGREARVRPTTIDDESLDHSMSLESIRLQQQQRRRREQQQLWRSITRQWKIYWPWSKPSFNAIRAVAFLKAASCEHQVMEIRWYKWYCWCFMTVLVAFGLPDRRHQRFLKVLTDLLFLQY